MLKKQRGKPPQHSSNGHSKAREAKPSAHLSSKTAAKGTKAPPSEATKKKNNSNTNGGNTVNNKIDYQALGKCTPPAVGVAKKRKTPPMKTANGSTKEQQSKSETVLPAKRRRGVVESESNSEAEDYIDKFFADISKDTADPASGPPSSGDDTESDTETDTETDENDTDDCDGEGMALDELVSYYGKRRDCQETKKSKSNAKAPKTPTKWPACKAASSAGWLEEDNDRELHYETEDAGEAAAASRKDSPAKSKKKKIKMKRGQPKAVLKGQLIVQRRELVCGLNGKQPSASKGSGSDESWTDATDDFSDDSDSDRESDSDLWTDDSEDEYYGRPGSECSSDDSGHIYLNQPYDSDSYDEDFDPSNSESDEVSNEDLYIPRGTAQIYDIDDDSIPFDEGVSQIIELSCDGAKQRKKSATDAASFDAALDSDASCPALLPIYNKCGEFVDTIEKLEVDPGPAAEAANAEEAAPVTSSQEAVEKQQTSQTKEDEHEDENKSPGEEQASEASDELMEQNVSVEEPKQSSLYRFYDAIDRRMSLGVLKQQLYLYGHVSVQALFGRVELMGYLLETAETQTICAVRGYNAINLIPLPSPEAFNRAAFEKILHKLKVHFIDADIGELLASFDPADSVLVLLQADPAGGATLPVISSFLEEYALFPTTSTLTGKSALRRTELLLEVEMFTPDVTPSRPVPLFQKHPSWDAVRLQPSSRIVVVGGKGSGKSTLCQFLVNRFIKQYGRILLVDLDIGQPLLYLPETISASVLREPVIGVGCLAKVQPLRCLLFGSLNVVSSPLGYIRNVRTLVQHCEGDPELRGVPWIVNTMGYVTGFGEELTAAIVQLVRPTDLIQLALPLGEKRNQNYQQLLTEQHVNGFKFNILQEEVGHLQQERRVHYRCHPFDVTFKQRGCPLMPAKRRTLSIMTQLVRILDDTTEWFTDMTPFCAPLDELQVLITRDEYHPSKETLPSILNAMMVYLCERLDNDQYNCLGLGIVRSVDHNGIVHLLHHLPPEELARAKVLALCNTSLPSQIYLRMNTKMDGTIPYLQNVVA